MTRSAPSLPLVLCCVLGLAQAATGQTTVSIGASKDNTLFQSLSGNTSSGAGDDVFCGVTAVGRLRRALVAFDVAGAVPAGATITSVQLDMTLTMSISGPLPVSLHRVLDDWGEGTSNSTVMGGGGGAPSTAGDATWIHRFYPTDFWATVGGDFSGTASGSAMVGSAFGVSVPVSWTSTPQMVADVQSWLDAPASNFGWLLKTAETGNATAKRFSSSEHSVASERPSLVVTYTTGPTASVVPVGAGCVGSSSTALQLATNGLPTIGNLGFAFDLTGGFAGGSASLFFAFGSSDPGLPLPPSSCQIHLDLMTAVDLINAGISPFGPNTLDGSGATFFPLPIINDPSLGGITFSAQGLLVDPLAPAGIVTSNALDVTFGN